MGWRRPDRDRQRGGVVVGELVQMVANVVELTLQMPVNANGKNTSSTFFAPRKSLSVTG